LNRQLTAFSDFRFPLSQGDHVSLPEFVAYLHRYADHFALWPRIKTATRVVGVNRVEGGHLVRVRKGDDGGAPSLSLAATAARARLLQQIRPSRRR
jgi:dimethylaniline monooxygenase (N-oxide forming)